MDGEFGGVLIGTVVARDDPQGEGRILVTFQNYSDPLESFWAPIANPMAGNGRGFRFCPEIGDECLVGFDRGDPDHPYIIGFLHNGVDKLPAADPQERVIASVNGHTIIFRDPDPQSGNKGALIIRDGHGTQLEMTNGHVRMTVVGQMDINAPVLTLNGRPVAPGTGMI
jgi:uncharacterized protein involved in type VI secretion and phage assembly